MPTPEQWRLYLEEIERSRKPPPYWLKRAPGYYGKTTEARVAVADYLTACEELLREQLPLVAEGENVTISLNDYVAWRQRIEALLGSKSAKVT